MVGTGQKTKTHGLAGELAATLEQGIEVVASLSDAVFRNDGPRSSVGAHIRHNLEFVLGFLNGIEAGSVDYAARERDERIATDREYAVAAMRSAARTLRGVAESDLMKTLDIRSEINAIDCASSVGRELEFLVSHTIHHYALISFKLELLGIAVPANFGVAPSTIRFWSEESETVGEES